VIWFHNAISACECLFCAGKTDARCEYIFKTADVYCADLLYFHLIYFLVFSNTVKHKI